MRRHPLALLTALLLLLLGGSTVPGTISAALAQEPSLDAVVKAVVRISGQRCEPVCREAGQGSGAIIHPSGVILTAYHVILDPEKSPAQPLDDFIIEMSDDPRQPAVAHIGRTSSPYSLPSTWRSSASTGLLTARRRSRRLSWRACRYVSRFRGGVRLQEQLLILGYPFLGGRSIKVDNKNLTGFASERLSGREVSDAFMTVQGRLSEGYSGGPVLAEKDGGYQIVGTVIKGVGVGQEIGYLRSIDLLRDLTWLEPQARANAEHVKLELVQNASGDQELRVSLNLDTLDSAGRRARLIFYAYADDISACPLRHRPVQTVRVCRPACLCGRFGGPTIRRSDRSSRLRVPVGASSIAATPLKFTRCCGMPRVNRCCGRARSGIGHKGGARRKWRQSQVLCGPSPPTLAATARAD